MTELTDYKPQPKGMLLQARLMYLGYYLALGSFMPYINLYYERLGLSGVQIGTLAALPVLVGAVATLIWGALADALRWHRGIFRLALVLGPLAVFLLSRVSTFGALIPLVIFYALVTSPIISLMDSAALEVAEAHQLSYGDMRLWGSIGWSIATWGVGALIEHFDIHWLFYSYIGFMLLTFMVTFSLPPRRRVLQAPFGHGLRRLLAQPGFLFFLLSIFLLSVTSSGTSSFFTLYMDGIGAQEGTIGLAWTLAAWSEIPVMLGAGAIMRRISAKGLIAIAFVNYALRWLLFSFITNPIWVLVVQLMHGLSFGAFLVGSVTYLNERTPEGLSTTALAIFNTTAFSLASITGSLIGGIFYDTLGLGAMFRTFSVVTLIGLVVLWLGVPRSERV